jgi:hypothetical protein
MARLDELIEELSEQGRQDDADELEKLRGSSLRKQATRATELEAEVQKLQSQLAERDAAPARETALREYGVDLENLSKAEKAIVGGLKGELTAEAIAKLVEDYDLPVAQSAGADGASGEAPAAQRVAQHAADAQRGARVGTGSISAENVAEWPADKTRRFMNEHPEAYEALLRGETVSGISF